MVYCRDQSAGQCREKDGVAQHRENVPRMRAEPVAIPTDTVVEQAPTIAAGEFNRIIVLAGAVRRQRLASASKPARI